MTRIVHFTDMHLRWHQSGSAIDPLRLSREMPTLLDRFSKCLENHNPDVLVMSGDVLDTPGIVLRGGSPDHKTHDEWIEDAKADFTLVKEWFEGTSIPYVVVPGNNDHEGAFASVFGGPPEPVDIAGLRFFCFWDELSDEQQPLRNGQRKALFDAAMTDNAHNCPQIHVHHYMIAPPIFAKNKHYQYLTADELRSDMERGGRVRAVLSGHYHPGTLISGSTVHSGAPAFCEAPHPYRLYDLFEDGRTVVTDHSVEA